MQDTHDPASYLRSEIAAYDAGLRLKWEPWQREYYLEVVLVEEAQAITKASEARSHDGHSSYVEHF